MDLQITNGAGESFRGPFPPSSVIPPCPSSLPSPSYLPTAYRPLHVEDLRSVSVLHPSRFYTPFGAAGGRSQRIYGTVAAGKATGAVVSCAFLPLDDVVVQALTATAQRAPTRGGVARKRKGEGSRAAEAAATARAAESVAGYDQRKGRNSSAAATGAIVARMGLMAAGTRVSFLDLREKEVVAHYSAIKDYARCVSCRSDGKLFAVSDDAGVLQIVQTDTRQLLRRLKGHTGSARGCCFDSDKTRVVSVGDDSTVRWWELSTGECLRILTGHTDAVRSVDVPRDFPAAAEKYPSQDAGGSTGGCPATAASAASCLTGSYDCTARLWDLRTAEEGSCVLKHERPVEYVRFVDCVASAPLLLSCSANEVRLWDVRQTGRSICAVSSHVKTVTAAHVVPGAFATTAAAVALSFSSRSGSSSDSSSSGRRKRGREELGEEDAEAQAEVEEEEEDEEEEEEEESEDDEDEEEEGNALRRVDREELRSGLVLASTSLDGTLKLTSLRVDGSLGRRHGRLDRLLRSFQYQAALDISIATSPHSVVVALVAELLQRGGLEAAVRGRDAESVLPMLEFISRNITMKGGFSTFVVSELAMALLQECENWMAAAGSDDAHVLELLKRIAQKIAFELDQIRQMDRLHSLLDSLLAI